MIRQAPLENRVPGVCTFNLFLFNRFRTPCHATHGGRAVSQLPSRHPPFVTNRTPYFTPPSFPLFSYTYERANLQVLCFQMFATVPGVGGGPSLLPILEPSSSRHLPPFLFSAAVRFGPSSAETSFR